MTASPEDLRRRDPRDPRTWLFLMFRTLKDAHEDRVIGLGAEVAFFALLSLPPTILAIFGAVGYLAEALGPQATGAIRQQLIGVAGTFMNASAVEQVSEIVDQSLSQGRAAVLSLGLFIALWSASRATNVSIAAVNIAYDIEETRKGLRRRAIALGITFLGILGAIVVIPLVVAGPRILARLGFGDSLARLWQILYWPGVGILGILLLATFYHYAHTIRTPWRRDLPGAVLAAALWLAGAAGLRVYVAMSIAADSTYGPLAAPIAILLWLYVTSMALLLGAELNAEIEKVWPTTPERYAHLDAEGDAVAAPQEDEAGAAYRITRRVETLWKR